MAGLILVGCSATAPRDSPWDAIELFDNTPPTEPLDLPLFPTFGESADGLVTLTPAEGQELLIYQVAAEANTEIAWEHADQVADMRTAYNALSRAGQAEHEIAELRQTLLEEERRAHFWSRITDWILIGILGIAVAR